jgi:4-amino-4-deoxy-L-arabinose transferase-like glycosyltransferase
MFLRWQTIALFSGALLIRLVLSPFPGFWGDTNLLVEYSRVMVQKGLLGAGEINCIVLYPAGYLYHSYVVGHVLKNKFRNPDTYNVDGMTVGGASAVERMGVRTVPIAYDLMMAAVLLIVLSRNVSRQAGEWGAAIYLLNPGVIVNSAMWNYDSLPSFYQLLAVVLAGMALRSGRDVFWLLTWVAAGLAFSMKVQAGMLVPVLGVITLCTRRVKLVIMGPIVFFAAVAVIFSPYLLTDQRVYLKKVFVDAFDAYPVTHVGAYNLWALWFQRPVSNRVAGLTLGSIGSGLFLASMAWLSWCIWRQKVASGAHALARAAIVFTYAFAAPFILLTRMHERYLAPTVAVAILAGLLDPRLRGAMWGFSIAYAVNMLTILTQGFWHLADTDLTQAVHISIAIVRFFCCLLIVVTFIWMTWRLPGLLKTIEPAKDNLAGSSVQSGISTIRSTV